MDADLSDTGLVVLTMTMDEALIVHERIAFAEFSADLQEVELPEAVHQAVFSDVQQSLRSLIPTLGTSQYADAVRDAEQRLA